MNEPIPPLSGLAYAPKTSGLAIWSLVLGIMSLVLICISPLFAIPAVICGHIALKRIKYSGGELEGNGLATGGLITGYVGIAFSVFFLPLLTAIAIPNFVKARATSQQIMCINNLRQIDAAKNQWALEHHKATGSLPTQDDLLPYLKNQQWLQCPAGGTYTIGAVDVSPTCSVTNHQLNSYSGSPGN